MKSITPFLFLAGGLLAANQAVAGDLLHFQDNSISYLNGSNLDQMNFNKEQQKSQSTFTIEELG